MADNVVQIVIDGKDNAGTAFTSAAAEAKAFQAAIDSSSRAEDRAAQTSVRASSVRERAFLKVMDAERMMDSEAQKASKIQADLSAAMHDGSTAIGQLAFNAGQAAEKLPGMVTPMTALVGAGVVLAPVLATLAVGLGGLGLAAYGVASPVMKAAQAAGGLQANMAKLDPEQQTLARSLLRLQGGYSNFQQALKPTVLSDFNAAIRAGEAVMKGAEPVAAATGKALAGVLSQVGAEFRSGTWQQFFGFMAQTAGPDLKMLGDMFVNLTGTLPPLLEGLQPVASQLLATGAGLSNLIRLASQAGGNLGQMASRSSQAGGAMGTVASWTERLTRDLATGFAPEMKNAWQYVASLGQKSGTTSGQMSNLSMTTIGAAAAARQEAAAMAAQTQAFIKGLSPLNNYVDATLNSANAEAALKTALKASGDRIGYKTQKQRDSFASAQTYIKNLENEASSALASGQGAKRAASDIQAGLGTLDRAKGKTGAYNTELARLKTLLDQLRAERNIDKFINIHVNGLGALVNANNSFVNGGGGGHLLASGGIAGAQSGGVRSGLTMVGEGGPELVRIPAGSQVYNNAQTRGMLGGHGAPAHVVLEVAPGGASAFEQFMLQALRRWVQVRGGNVQSALGWGTA